MSTAIDIHTKTEVLLEALPYVQAFRGSTFVVKVGGSFMEAEEAQRSVAGDLVFLAAIGIRVVVVHGGGKAISRAMEAANIPPVFRSGLRVTDGATVSIVERTLNTEINASVVRYLQDKTGLATGVFGQDVFRVETLREDSDGNPLDVGFVGRVVNVKPYEVEAHLAAGRIPVVSPVGMDTSGQFHNVNADAAAAALAGALKARRLVFLCDVPGLLRDPKDPSTIISTLHVDEVASLRQAGIIGSGMLPKVESGVAALHEGVRRVHFIDGRLAHSLLLEIFTDEGIGTEIVSTQDGL
jgi:acetylglutamate kinase